MRDESAELLTQRARGPLAQLLPSVERIAQRLGDGVDDVFKVVSAGETLSAGGGDEEGQCKRPLLQRKARQKLEIRHGVLLKGEERGADRAARPVRPIAAVVDALGLGHRARRE